MTMLEATFEQQLNRYFTNCKWTQIGNEFQLQGPGLSYLGLDQNLNVNLAGFSEHKLSLADVADFHEAKDGYNLCFEDTWSLLFWLRYLKANPGVKKINIIHLDDHTDLMPPLLYKEQGEYFQVTDDKNVNFDDPESIAGFIREGSINLGSFIAPLIFFLDSVNIFHLRKELSPNGTTKQNLVESYINDFPYLDKDRISISVTDKNDKSAKGFYYRGNDMKSLIGEINGDPTFLHIDLDYFLNQFNGNFRNDNSANMITKIELEEEISSICAELSCVRSQIVDVTIATSPGFCPSSHWEFLISNFMERFNKI
ncbi:hypothetical protein [Mucilaginibacter lappiensis]|uniref:Uncharacterized protein n=1 Tax=Mucilaginibacter lappiensis TaxID=354630 RepID=A0A841JJ97_9SPHI|nr:hypothetical protein [Mucilaginibacter lappiensis]MBB6131030.1 hypothetical protein [Mucilaginibacter lappiensis]